MNWMRLYCSCRARAIVRTSSVLPRPGSAFEQHVAARQQRDRHPAHDQLLADDDARHLALERLDGPPQLLDRAPRPHLRGYDA